MPLPMRPDHVHCYLVPVEDGYMLVDTGLGLPDAKEAWAAILGDLQAPVVTTFLTHFHPDHLGAAADLCDLTGARTVQGRLDAQQTRMVWGNDAWSDRLAEWFHRNGVPAGVTEELIGQGARYRPFVRAASNPEPVADGDLLHGWELVAAPGHADGQLTLLRDGVLIAADHLLARITPTVGLWPESRPDPLGDYIKALERTIELEPTVAYGGHGDVVADPMSRARELISHHDERLRAAAAALGPEPLSGYEVSYPLFGDDLGPGARRFAVAETLSHLERLVCDGRADRHEAAAAISYTAR
jgi:glyoxylase-like metal-dependent hydrolase (beta-lactamase superfamily II)